MKEIYHMLCGADDRLSLRRVLAVIFVIGLIRMTEAHIKGTDINTEIYFTVALLITSMLGLTTASTLISKKFDKEQKIEDDEIQR